MANRSLKTLTLFFTILATNFSAFYFIGYAGEGYRVGYAHYIMMATGTGLAGLSIYLIGTKTWQLGKQHGFITPAEMMYHQTESKGIRYLFAAVMIVYTLPYLSLQIIGGGYILENLTEGQIPYSLATLLLTLFTIAYVVVGGMHSVAKTDLKQGVLMIVLMCAAVVAICYQLGGAQEAHQQVYALKPDLFSMEGSNNHYTPQKWFSFTVFWFFCIPMFPQLFMRFFIAKSEIHLKKTVILYAFIPIIIAIFPVVIGVLGHLSFPGLTGKAADQILPMMLVEHTAPWFAALVMIGAIAAFMSTLDSQLLALSTITCRDVYLPLTGKEVSFKREVFIGRLLVALFALIGYVISLNPFDTIFDMGKLAFAGYAVLFPITFVVLRSKGTHPAFGIASIIVGQMLLIGFYYEWIPKTMLMGFEPFIAVLLLCFLIVWVGMFFKPAKYSTNKG
ncbi:MAG: sodium:solute symporter family protein [Saprospiraceae bacterium]|nr:sodium:solute symporter family protein [Saprospiraceae bacterium]